MPVNLSKFECIPTKEEYNKIYNRTKKKIISKATKQKKPLCKIFTGPPGSGKSRLADIGGINIDIDQIIDDLYESKELEKLGVKHGNVIDSCGDVASRVSDDLINYCVSKQYNFSMHTLYGTQLEFLYFLRENLYKIEVYYVYDYNAYNNNKNRKKLNISKKIYSAIIEDMSDIRSLFAMYSVADKFMFVKIITQRPTFKHVMTSAKDWKSTKKTIINIIKKVKAKIK